METIATEVILRYTLFQIQNFDFNFHQLNFCEIRVSDPNSQALNLLSILAAIRLFFALNLLQLFVKKSRF